MFSEQSSMNDIEEENREKTLEEEYGEAAYGVVANIAGLIKNHTLYAESQHKDPNFSHAIFGRLLGREMTENLPQGTSSSIAAEILRSEVLSQSAKSLTKLPPSELANLLKLVQEELSRRDKQSESPMKFPKAA